MRVSAAIGAVLLLGVACGGGGQALPVLGEVPSFVLTDRTNAPFGSDDLAGRPWVAGFIFTRCPDVCPAVTAQMKRAQDGLAGASVPLVSFSVDPAYDTTERLSEYAARHGAKDDWHFVTGDRATIARVLTDGFKVAFGDDGPSTTPITHSDRLVLVDATGKIRGYYHGRADEDVDRLIGDATRLASETP